MTPYASLTAVTAVSLVCDCVADVTGYNRANDKPSREGGDRGWDILSAVLLGGYALGCHSLRHVIGGTCDELKSDARATAYHCVTCLNARHMLWAWCSLVSVAFADIYVRLCATGVWTDWRLL